MTKRTFFSPYFFASNQANLCASVRSDPVFDSSCCFDHTHVHTSSRMQGCSENHELVLFGAGCSAVILVCAFPFACLLWCRSSEDFQGGQIVPEAAPGAVTTTGQLFQSTGPLLGDVIETHAFGGTQRWQHTHTHTQSTNWHCQTRWHAAHSRAQEDITLPAVWHVQVSLCGQDKPWLLQRDN